MPSLEYDAATHTIYEVRGGERRQWAQVYSWVTPADVHRWIGDIEGRIEEATEDLKAEIEELRCQKTESET